MIGGRQRQAVSYVIATSWSADGKYMCSVNEPELYSRHRTAITVGEKDLTLESSVSAQSTDFRYDPLALRWKRLKLTLPYRLLHDGLIEQSADVCISTVTM